MHIKAKILSAVAGILLVPQVASAAIIETSIGRYDVTTTLTSFNASQSLLKSQVWWENVPLAEEFATLVGTLFGTPNLGIYAPFFWQTDRDTTGPCAGIGEPFAGIFWDHRAGRASPVCAASAPNGPFTFAIASAVSVPEPSTIGLLGLGLVGVGFVRRKARVRRPGALALATS